VKCKANIFVYPGSFELASCSYNKFRISPSPATPIVYTAIVVDVICLFFIYSKHTFCGMRKVLFYNFKQISKIWFVGKREMQRKCRWYHVFAQPIYIVYIYVEIYVNLSYRYELFLSKKIKWLSKFVLKKTFYKFSLI